MKQILDTFKWDKFSVEKIEKKQSKKEIKRPKIGKKGKYRKIETNSKTE